MRTNQPSPTTHRRGFLGAITKGAAAFGLTSLALPFNQLTAAEAGQKKRSPMLLQMLINGLTR